MYPLSLQAMGLLSLTKVIEDAYKAFAGYPRPLQMHASPLRKPKKILATLSSAPLRELTEDQVGYYAGCALTTVGDVSDYKHFLPRILELAAGTNTWLGLTPPIIANKLRLGEWRTWPASEQSSLLAVFMAAWRNSSINHPYDVPNAWEWLQAYASLGENFRPLLGEWLTRLNGNSLLQFANLVAQLPQLLALDEDDQIFWAHVPAEARAEIVPSLVSPRVRAALSKAEGIGEDDLWHLAAAKIAIDDHFEGTRH
ncbi:MAG TPA: hypothetical protein VJQ54_15655 [Candidatus Sulfotelmatobacter sp.]|nr:hypothetical protein [Candidatus Sulfotelmatobacter sp.]